MCGLASDKHHLCFTVNTHLNTNLSSVRNAVWLREFYIDFPYFLPLMQLLSSFKQCNSSWDGQTWVLLMQQLIIWLPPAEFILDEWLARQREA